MESWKHLHAKSRVIGIDLMAASALLCLLIAYAPASAAAATPTIAVSPTFATVGSTITISGSGFPPNTSIILGWTSENASWQIQAIPTPQVTGIKSSPLLYKLGSTQSDPTGSFSAPIAVPSDYGGSHAIQAYATNGTAISPVASFILIPHFQVSPTGGPAGTPIRVEATGLGIGIYSASYHLYWDNSYVGYMTAVNTNGVANFTFYASGTPGPHYVSIHEGYPGPGYFNPQQGPPGPGALAGYSPPNIPFYANFTVTPEQVTPRTSSDSPAAFVSGPAAFGSLGLLAAALAGGSLFASRKAPRTRDAISRAVMAVAIIALVVVAGVGVYVASTSSGTQGSTSQTQSGPKVAFSPVAVVVRPHITVAQNNATTGPRISVSPDVASVGDNVTVEGQGFAPNAQLPLVWTTRQGSNVIGYKLVDKPLRNVTASADGSFSFTWKVPSAVGGTHFVAAGNLTRNSNGTFFIQRTAMLSATQGPLGTKIQIILHGVGWDFNTNIAAFDYDNSYVGYGCGFNSGGNVTLTIPATGAPGIHTIDVYPSVWWGPSNFANQQTIEYRYPLLTPPDHPELMPSFHFTFLITSG
jgi:hypothetical protein